MMRQDLQLVLHNSIGMLAEADLASRPYHPSLCSISGNSQLL
jgi:hypothetical protein